MTRRASLSREARIASGYCTIRVSKAIRAALLAYQIEAKPRPRSAGASTDDKIAFLLLAPKMTPDTGALFISDAIRDEHAASKKRRGKK